MLYNSDANISASLEEVAIHEAKNRAIFGIYSGFTRKQKIWMVKRQGSANGSSSAGRPIASHHSFCDCNSSVHFHDGTRGLEFMPFSRIATKRHKFIDRDFCEWQRHDQYFHMIIITWTSVCQDDQVRLLIALYVRRCKRPKSTHRVGCKRYSMQSREESDWMVGVMNQYGSEGPDHSQTDNDTAPWDHDDFEIWDKHWFSRDEHVMPNLVEPDGSPDFNMSKRYTKNQRKRASEGLLINSGNMNSARTMFPFLATTKADIVANQELNMSDERF